MAISIANVAADLGKTRLLSDDPLLKARGEGAAPFAFFPQRLFDVMGRRRSVSMITSFTLSLTRAGVAQLLNLVRKGGRSPSS